MILEFKKIWRKAKKKGFFHLLSASYIVQFFGFASLLLVSKLLPPEELGAVRVMQSYIDIMVVVSSLGMGSAVLKFCAENNVDRIYIFNKAQMYGLGGSVIGIILLNAFIFFESQNESDLVIGWLPIYSLVIIAAVSTNIFVTYLQAVQKFKHLAVSQAVLKIFTVIIVVIVTYVYGVSGYIIALICSFYITVIYFWKKIGIQENIGEMRIIPNGFYKLAATSWCGNTIAIIANYVDLLMLNIYIDDKCVLGYYAIATIFLTIGRQFVGVVQSFLTPFFSMHSYDRNWVIKNTFKHQIILPILIAVLAVGIYSSCYFFVWAYYGEKYNIILYIISYLLIQLILYSSYAIIGAVLLAINRNKYNVYEAMVKLFLKIVVLGWLLQEFGLRGLLWGQILIEIPTSIMVWWSFNITMRGEDYEKI